MSAILSRFHLASLSPLLLLLLAVGCSSRDPRIDHETQYLGAVGRAIINPTAPFDTVSYWDGDGVPGSPSIKIDLGEQRASFYKGGQLVGISTISSGREGHGTTTGSFKITQKDKNHRSNLYGDYVDADGNVVVADIDIKKDPKPPGTVFRGASMPNFMRIVGGIGMHAGFLPGYPASHGCIRMPEFMSEAFFRNVDNGTPVTVTH